MSQCFDDNTKTLTQEKPSRRQALQAMSGWRFLLMVLVSLLAFAPQSWHPSPVAAATLSSYAFAVNTTADTHDAHPGDGKCADSNGKCSLRAAIEEADALPSGSSITIMVPAGTYPLTLGTLGLTANTITISGALSKTTIINGKKQFTVMTISVGVSTSLSQLTIENGYSNGGYNGGGINNAGMLTVSESTFSNNSAQYGGGIYNGNGGTVSVSDTTISGNSAIGGCTCGSGGGILNDKGGTVSVSHSAFSNNSAASEGGGIYNYDSFGVVTVTSSTFSNNSAYEGGGIYNQGGTVSVSHSAFSNNPATGYGGGIDNDYGGTVSVSHSAFSNNSAAYEGGGIYNDNFGTVSVSQSTFSGNKAIGQYAPGSGGGIDNQYHGTVSVSQSTFSNNSATGYGGGIANEYLGMVSVSNSTFSYNSAYEGGGIANGSGSLSVSQSTFSGNSASVGGTGGGIANANGDTTTLTDTIVANSSGPNCAGTITDGGYNLDSGSSCGFTNHALTNTDPMLGPLRDNGGPTQTMALRKGSNAIDWVALGSCPDTDQRGHMRPDNNESACDIGAYESSY